MKRSTILIAITMILALLGALAGYIYFKQEVEDMNYTTFVSQLEEGKVREVTIKSNDFLQVTLEDNRIYLVPNPQSDTMKEYFLLNGAEVTNSKRNQDRIVQTLLTLSVVAFVLFTVKKGVGKDRIELVNANQGSKDKGTTYTFNSIAGNEEAKDMVRDIIDFIKDPKKYESLGAKMPRGILLYGPPGTGKTLMAKAIAGESGVPFYAVSGSDFVQMYVGVGASRVRQLFNKAKKSKKAVIFIDEIDAIGKKRGAGLGQGNDERDQTLNALLTEMSGFSSHQGIVVVAATNRLDTLDEALLRPGRFDRLIEVGLPDFNARQRILKLHLQGKPVSHLVDIARLSRETVYFSGAMLENLANEAAIIAANENASEITQRHLDQAFYHVIVGSEKKDRGAIGKEDLSITAYHESGHALATRLLLPENRLSKVTIIPSTKGFGGFNLSIPKERLYRTKQHILREIKVLLAGRAAEELIFGADNITTGASNDIERASQQIKMYIMKFGMDEELGLFNSDAAEMSGDSFLLGKCRDLIKVLYKEVKELLNDHVHLLHRIAKELLEKESISGEEIDAIIESVGRGEEIAI